MKTILKIFLSSLLLLPLTRVSAQCATLTTCGSKTLCTAVTNTVQLSASASPGGGNIVWNPGTLPGSPVVVSPSSTTIYTVTVTYTNGCTASKTLAVTVSTNCCTQTPTITTRDTLFCRNFHDSVRISAGTSPSGGTIHWYPGGGSGPFVVVSPTTTTIYTVSVTYTNGCVGTKTMMVTVSNTCCIITPTITTKDTLFCRNLHDSIKVSASASPAGGTIHWQPGGGSGTSVWVSPTVTTIYTVSVTYTNGCAGTKTMMVTVTNTCCTQTPTMIARDTSICINVIDSVRIGVTVFPSGGTITWQPGGGTGPSVSVSPTVTTTYTVKVTYTTGCVGMDTLTVHVTTHCCPSSTTTVLSSTSLSGVTLNGPLIIMNNITIGGSAVSTFQNGEFLMAPNVQINILKGSELHLNGAHLYACGHYMWQGIYVKDSARIVGATSTQVTLIEDAISAVNLPNAVSPAAIPISMNGVIFNKNYVSIEINNGSITSLPIVLNACVFTSRSLPFTQTQWPGSTTGSPDLRYAPTGALTGLSSPYTLQGFTYTNLKNPYNFQPAHIGIDIDSVGNTVGPMPAPGVQFGSTVDSLFNLFDGVGTGINILNGSLSTMNNVFQNMPHYSTTYSPFSAGGTGIKHTITSLMNARLALYPQGAAPQNTAHSNRFWNCYYGIQATNVLDFHIDFGLFRSTQTTAAGGAFKPGYKGIYLNSNRFLYKMRHNEFNNLDSAVCVPIVSGNYNVGAGTVAGIYADSLVISQNYFGPQVSSSTALGTNYLNLGIILTSPSPAAITSGPGAYIQSNKLNRVYRGVFVGGMAAYPTFVDNNLISLTDDILLGLQQRGIAAIGTRDRLKIRSNTLSGTGLSNQQITLVYCESNAGTLSPEVTCNTLSQSYEGFEFNQSNSAALWKGNTMTTHKKGMVLKNGGVIGVQGSNTAPSDNQWLGGASGWTGNFGTYTDGSTTNASASKLWVRNNALPWYPPANSGLILAQSYNVAANIPISASGTYVCATLGLPTPPTNRLASTDNEEGETSVATISKTQWQLEIFPNPTATGNITLVSDQDSELLTINIKDLAGKTMMNGQITTENSKAELRLLLEDGVYLVELRGAENKVIHKKLVISRQ